MDTCMVHVQSMSSLARLTDADRERITRASRSELERGSIELADEYDVEESVEGAQNAEEEKDADMPDAKATHTDRKQSHNFTYRLAIDKSHTFTEWLLSQQSRKDNIGRFAKEVAADRTWPRRGITYQQFFSYMKGEGALASRLETLARAWSLYIQLDSTVACTDASVRAAKKRRRSDNDHAASTLSSMSDTVPKESLVTAPAASTAASLPAAVATTTTAATATTAPVPTMPVIRRASPATSPVSSTAGDIHAGTKNRTASAQDLIPQTYLWVMNQFTYSRHIHRMQTWVRVIGCMPVEAMKVGVAKFASRMYMQLHAPECKDREHIRAIVGDLAASDTDFDDLFKAMSNDKGHPETYWRLLYHGATPLSMTVAGTDVEADRAGTMNASLSTDRMTNKSATASAAGATAPLPNLQDVPARAMTMDDQNSSIPTLEPPTLAPVPSVSGNRIRKRISSGSFAVAAENDTKASGNRNQSGNEGDYYSGTDTAKETSMEQFMLRADTWQYSSLTDDHQLTVKIHPKTGEWGQSQLDEMIQKMKSQTRQEAVSKCILDISTIPVSIRWAPSIRSQAQTLFYMKRHQPFVHDPEKMIQSVGYHPRLEFEDVEYDGRSIVCLSRETIVCRPKYGVSHAIMKYVVCLLQDLGHEVSVSFD